MAKKLFFTAGQIGITTHINDGEDKVEAIVAEFVQDGDNIATLIAASSESSQFRSTYSGSINVIFQLKSFLKYAKEENRLNIFSDVIATTDGIEFGTDEKTKVKLERYQSVAIAEYLEHIFDTFNTNGLFEISTQDSKQGDATSGESAILA